MFQNDKSGEHTLRRSKWEVGNSKQTFEAVTLFGMRLSQNLFALQIRCSKWAADHWRSNLPPPSHFFDVCADGVGVTLVAYPVRSFSQSLFAYSLLVYSNLPSRDQKLSAHNRPSVGQSTIDGDPVGRSERSAGWTFKRWNAQSSAGIFKIGAFKKTDRRECKTMKRSRRQVEKK